MSVDKAVAGREILIEGLVFTEPQVVEVGEGATIHIEAGDEALALFEGLRGSEIAENLQSMTTRSDGVDLLAGTAWKDKAVEELEAAGLAAPHLDAVKSWPVELVSVSMVDKRQPIHP